MANHIVKSMTIKWADKAHVIAVTNELGNALESSGINLFQMYLDNMRGGTPKMFLVSDLISKILFYGASEQVEQNAILQSITRSPDASKFLRGFVNDFLDAMFPAMDADDMGKSEEVEETKTASKKAKK